MLILDIMMPGQSGLELLQQIRPAVQTPVIMLTGRGMMLTGFWGWRWGRMIILLSPAIPVSWLPGFVQYCAGQILLSGLMNSTN